MTAVESPAPRRLGSTVAPLSFAQERLWLIDAAAPGTPTYNVPLLTRWHEPVVPAALAAALSRVVARHEVLRTTYALREDVPVQVVGEPAPVTVEVVNATTAAPTDAELSARIRRPFDLATGPVLRCTVWRGTPGGDLMLIVVHHIAIDGWSLGAFYSDLAEAYGAALTGGRPGRSDLPELPLQYADFARWDRETFARPRRQQQLANRVAELRDAEEGLILAGARPGPVAPEGERPGGYHTFPLPVPLWQGISELAQTVRATPFVVLHAAFQTVLQRWSGREEFVVGATTANRPHPDVEPLIGFFVNTVPMRCQTSPEWTVGELCTRVRAESYRLLTNQWIPFDRLTSALAAERGHRQLVNVCFSMQNMPPVRADTPRWSPPEVLHTGTARFDLVLFVEETPGGVVGSVEYDTDRYPDDVCDGVISTFLEVLAGMSGGPGVPVRRLAPAPAHLAPAPGHLARVPAHRAPAPAPAGREPAAQASAGERQLHTAMELFGDALATIGKDRAAGIGPASNFFALGGHSLLAVTMLAQAGRRYGVPVSPREFFADPTIAGLARLLETANNDPGPLPAEAGASITASSAQQRFWFLDRIPALRTAYLMPTVVELNGRMDRAALRTAVDRVLARHPALRSRFTLDRKQRRVTYRTDGPPAAATVTDASGWPPEKLAAHLADRCWSTMDLAHDAPARADIVAPGPDRTLLVLTLHHIAADGWSRNLIVDQIAEVYTARGAADLAAPIHPGTVQREPDPVQTEDLVAWLTGVPVDIPLPHDRPRPDVQSTLAGSVSVTLDPRLTARLRALAAEAACTTFTMAAALLGITLARRSGQRDLLFAFPWFGRETPDSEAAVAMLLNTLPLRVDLRGVETWREVLGRVRESAAVSYRNADASYDVVAAAVHPDRDLSRPPMTPVYLSMDEGSPTAPAFAGIRARYLPPDPLHIKYELELIVTDHPDAWEFCLSYAVDLFDRATVEALARDLVTAATDVSRSQKAEI